ncbi:MAG: hypothetical protein ACJ75J_03405 [Cytophagaceae bacterium]
MRPIFLLSMAVLFLYACTNSEKQPVQSMDSSAVQSDKASLAVDSSANVNHDLEADTEQVNYDGDIFMDDKSTTYRGKTEDEIKANPRDIVDYYLLFPNPKGFEVKRSNESGNEFRARVRSLQPAEKVSIVIDKANAYISINDASEELGSEMQMTRYTTATGSAYIAARFYGDGGDCASERFLIYEYKNQEWKDVTTRTLPALKMADFYKEGTLPSFDLQQFDVTYILPQKGTTIKAYIHPLCELDPLFPESGISWDTYYEAYKKAKYDTIPLYWNKTKAVFQLTK